MPEAVVGRERELEAAAAFLGRIAEGPSGLLLEGDAGVGKTTLWLDVIRQAEERGYCVLRARPVEAELKLSYAALADLVGGVLDEVTASLPPPRERALANGAPLIATPATPPRFQSSLSPSASLYQATAASASGTISITDRLLPSFGHRHPPLRVTTYLAPPSS